MKIVKTAGWILLGCIGLGIFWLTTYGTYEKLTVTVTGTEYVEKTYMVFTETETFTNSDSLLSLKFDSSDLHGKLKNGQYEVEVYGYRFGPLTMHRNIVTAERSDD